VSTALPAQDITLVSHSELKLTPGAQSAKMAIGGLGNLPTSVPYLLVATSNIVVTRDVQFDDVFSLTPQSWRPLAARASSMPPQSVFQVFDVETLRSIGPSSEPLTAYYETCMVRTLATSGAAAPHFTGGRCAVAQASNACVPRPSVFDVPELRLDLNKSVALRVRVCVRACVCARVRVCVVCEHTSLCVALLRCDVCRCMRVPVRLLRARTRWV
jgi:hypothetical protein